jgi:haloalkane dehalogenase
MTEVRGKRMCFVDHGSGRPVLLLHGNPTWSFLWRKVIHRLDASRMRIIAPDLIGFGFSDKPRSPAEHRLDEHIACVRALIVGLDLTDLTIVGQDWGGPIAAGQLLEEASRIRAAVFANTGVLAPARPFRSKAFHRFSHLPVVSDLMFRGFGFPLALLDRVQGDRTSIGPLEKRAYLYPLRRVADRAGPLGLARMVPDSESHPTTAVMDRIGAAATSFQGPTALVWGLRDPILGRGLRRHRDAMPHASVTETQAGHFLQEEVPDELARAISSVTLESSSRSPRSDEK